MSNVPLTTDSKNLNNTQVINHESLENIVPGTNKLTYEQWADTETYRDVEDEKINVFRD